MTAVEVLAPLRLETRFVAPADRTGGGAGWLLRVRVYPDEFSIRRSVPPPAPAELDRLAEAVASLRAHPPHTEVDAFESLATAVGASRALFLWRAHVSDDGPGGLAVDRSAETPAEHSAVHEPAGLPAQLHLWFVHADGTRTLAATLAPDAAAISADLDLKERFADATVLEAGQLPDLWWLSYARAVKVGLGIDVELGPAPPALDALVVVGLGDDDAAELVDAHNLGGRLAILAPGTPTNTVAGEATTDLGADARTTHPLLHADAAAQQSTRDVLAALTGRVPAGAMPLLGGDLDHYGPASLAVQGLWPVLWGRALRDVVGTGVGEVDLARWAIHNLAVQGPHPAIRVGRQPYGLLPTTSFAAWVDDPGDPLADLESRIRAWGQAWRAGAAAAARAAGPRVHGAGTADLLAVLGLHAPSRRWNVRPIADLRLLQTTRALAGLTPMPLTAWDRATAGALGAGPWPLRPIGPAGPTGAVPGPPGDAVEDPTLLAELVHMDPESLYFAPAERLGLVGHLFREALIAGRAVVGEAIHRLQAGDPVVLDRALPLDDEAEYVPDVMRGTDEAVEALDRSGDPNGRILATRFREVQEALEVIAGLWDRMAGALFDAVLAALDTAAFRVDPWLVGIAERRLQQMAAGGAPFRLGAYGWVDAPKPFAAGGPGALAPGPTAAGVLHAPSHTQALAAALLRDAAVRYPGDDRWRLTLDSAKVRASVAMAERVRLGVHPYEALGLEVEKVAGDWETVRTLRQTYPLAADQQERRVCDGPAVLRAARDGTLPLGLPPTLAADLTSLDDVIDTYADLLVADGVHALVSGRADLAGAAMEAAAGLGAPADLRAIRTPREATVVRVAAWALLDPGEAAVAADRTPVRVADPAFAALVTTELGSSALHATDPAAVEARRQLATVLGGGEDGAPEPALVGGDYEGLGETADVDLRAEVIDDLAGRLVALRDLAATERTEVEALDPDAPATATDLGARARRWAVDLSGVAPEDPSATEPTAAEARAALADALGDRLHNTATAVGSTLPHELRAAVRVLAGRPELPVLPIVHRALLPALRAVPDLDRRWLELVSAVRPRLAALEARQLDPARTPWPTALAAPGASTDPWHPTGPVLVAYGPAAAPAGGGRVALAVLDAWTDSVPSRRHTTAAAFGFNSPKARAPQAILLAVPPDPAERLTDVGLLDVVLETRELAHARAARPTDRAGLPYATPAPLVHAGEPVEFLRGWPSP